VNDTAIVVAVLVALLGLEWRYRRKLMRVGTALLALAIYFFYQPSYTSARRRALGTPPAERVTMSPVAGSETDALSGYDSGVYTTMRWVVYYHDFGAGARLAAIGALLWLACSPAFRSPHHPKATQVLSPGSASSAPEA
jgi:hypothetical protein